MLFLRKITISKWPTNRTEAIKTAKDCLADSVNDVRTQQAVLSFWDCSLDEVKDELCANIVLGGNKIEKTSNFVVLDSEELLKMGMNYNNTPNQAKCIIDGLDKYHYDVTIGDLENLEKVIIYISNIVLSDVCRIKRENIINAIKKAYSEGRLKTESIDENILKQLNL